MTKALIYKPARNAMQSGTRGRSGKWMLEYVPASNPHFIEPLMGWTGGVDTTRQIRMGFATMEEAVKYAETHHISYEILSPKARPCLPKSYADNFRYDKIET